MNVYMIWDAINDCIFPLTGFLFILYSEKGPQFLQKKIIKMSYPNCQGRGALKAWRTLHQVGYFLESSILFRINTELQEPLATEMGVWFLRVVPQGGIMGDVFLSEY